jgi:hypothetical protein
MIEDIRAKIASNHISGLTSSRGDPEMNTNPWQETFVETTVNYTVEVNGQFIVVENVPARVSLETGEQLLSPETVERLQQIIGEQREPDRIIEVPVFEFA